MSFTECPYCSFGYDYDGDTEGFNQDSDQEFCCPKCNKLYFASVYWSLCITSEQTKEQYEFEKARLKAARDKEWERIKRNQEQN